jgi:hypothetical protein
VTGYKTEILHIPPGRFSFDCKPELRAELQDNFAFCNEIGFHGGGDSPAVHPNEVSSSLDICDKIKVEADLYCS